MFLKYFSLMFGFQVFGIKLVTVHMLWSLDPVSALGLCISLATPQGSGGSCLGVMEGGGRSQKLKNGVT